MTIHALIADDHNVARQGLQMFLALDGELDVAGEAANGMTCFTYEETQRRTLLFSLIPEIFSKKIHRQP